MIWLIYQDWSRVQLHSCGGGGQRITGGGYIGGPTENAFHRAQNLGYSPGNDAANVSNYELKDAER